MSSIWPRSYQIFVSPILSPKPHMTTYRASLLRTPVLPLGRYTVIVYYTRCQWSPIGRWFVIYSVGSSGCCRQVLSHGVYQLSSQARKGGGFSLLWERLVFRLKQPTPLGALPGQYRDFISPEGIDASTEVKYVGRYYVNLKYFMNTKLGGDGLSCQQRLNRRVQRSLGGVSEPNREANRSNQVRIPWHTGLLVTCPWKLIRICSGLLTRWANQEGLDVYRFIMYWSYMYS